MAAARFVKRAKEIAETYHLNEYDLPSFEERFLVHLFSSTPAMKNPSFSEEKEWRMFTIRPNGTPSFRRARGIIIPYHELTKIPVKAFSSVTLGPALEPEFGVQAMQLFLKSYDLKHVQVRQSQIPLRVVAL
jgi:hypothetical protein